MMRQEAYVKLGGLNHCTMKYHIQTYGCQMNYSDSERVTTVLKKMGYTEADGEKDADLIILNTCSVKQRAHNRIYGLNEKFALLRKKNPKLRIGVTGCMAQITGLQGEIKNEHMRRLSTVDFMFKIKELGKLPKILVKLHGIKLDKAVDLDDLESYFHINPTITNIAQVFIPIMSGCNNYCSFCIVPYTRGKEEYRPMSEILEEVKKAAKRGSKEVNLVGQNVNTYRPKDTDKDSPASPFTQLLKKIDAVKGIDRIRFYAVHPKDMGDDVIETFKTLKSMVPHIHLPIQAGCDKVLKRMNRWYDTKRYRELVEKLRKINPDISISTDIIVGFCGETEEEFQETLDFLKEMKIDLVYVSKYSERKGTLADRTLEDDIPLAVKKEREQKVVEVIKEISNEYNKKFQNKTVKVLVERIDHKGFASGKIPEFKLCRFKSTDKSLIGKYVDVKIDKAMEWALEGSPVSK